MPFTRPILALILVAACLGACASSAPEATHSAATTDPSDPAAAMASAFHFLPAAAPRGAWVVLLPGASGLKIFDDPTHYFRAADALNAAGFDALLVDYKAAYRAAAHPPRVKTPDKIAWVTQQAVAWARRTGAIDATHPGAVVAWSMGTEGLWPLLADASGAESLGLRAAVAYYPSGVEGLTIRTAIPVLILTGADDDVSKAADIRAVVERNASPVVTVRVFPGALHGFDVASLSEPRTVSLIPLIGPSATFGFDAEAARAAADLLIEFLDRHVIR